MGTILADLASDLSYSLRALARRPGFTAVAVVTLALGIGANTAIFSAVHAYLLTPAPFAEPDALVTVVEATAEREMPVAIPNYLDVKRAATSFDGLAVYRWSSFNLTGGDVRPERIGANLASTDVFDVLGVELLMGRGFPAAATWVDEGPDLEESAARAAGAEDAGSTDSGQHEAPPAVDAEAARVAVISRALWQRRFAGSPDVLGATLRLDGQVFTVVGVTAESYRLPWSQPIDLWLPLTAFPDDLRSRDGHNNAMMLGRLAEGVTADAAAQEVAALYGRLAEVFPSSNRDLGAVVVPLVERLNRGTRSALLVLWGAVAFVLLIACANLANLSLTRAAARRRELSLRRALGAGRGRLVRQLLTESCLLGLAGGGLGVVLAAWGIEVLRRVAPPSPQAADMGLELPVLAFAVAVSLATGLAVGLLPALTVTRRATAESLAEGGRSGGPDRSGSRLRRGLVAAEVAMAVVLLIGAVLMIDSVRALSGVDVGFRTDGILVSGLLLSDPVYAEAPGRVAFAESLRQSLEARPDVLATAVASPLPLMNSTSASAFLVEGVTFGEGEQPWFYWSDVTPGYFEVMDMPLLAGRGFRDADHAEAPPVIVVDRLLAERLWPGESALGKRMRVSEEEPWATVVGVVPPIRLRDLKEEPKPHLYRPLAQRAPLSLHVVVATAGDPLAVAPVLRETVAALDPHLPVGEPVALGERRRARAGDERAMMVLISTFSALALALAALGIYGVMAYAVQLRTREIGVRMALGAARRQVVRMVLGEGMRVVAGGAVLGLAAGLALTRLMTGMLYGVEPGNPVYSVLVTGILGLVALTACLLPARRAAGVDPLRALRWE